MDDKHGMHQRPVRSASNRVKDLYNAYVRNEGSRTIPVSSPDSHIEDENEQLHHDSGEVAREFAIGENEIIMNRDDVENLIKRNEELENEMSDVKDQVLRKTAELENFRRRTLIEKQQLLDYGNEKLLVAFLPIVDDFKMAIDNGRKSDEINSHFAGVEMIYQKTLKFLEENGVKPMESSVGKHFDVNLHEAVMMMPSEFEEGCIVQEIQTGYMLNDKVLRHAKVITSSGQVSGESN